MSKQIAAFTLGFRDAANGRRRTTIPPRLRDAYLDGVAVGLAAIERAHRRVSVSLGLTAPLMSTSDALLTIADDSVPVGKWLGSVERRVLADPSRLGGPRASVGFISPHSTLNNAQRALVGQVLDKRGGNQNTSLAVARNTGAHSMLVDLEDQGRLVVFDSNLDVRERTQTIVDLFTLTVTTKGKQATV